MFGWAKPVQTKPGGIAIRDPKNPMLGSFHTAIRRFLAHFVTRIDGGPPLPPSSFELRSGTEGASPALNAANGLAVLMALPIYFAGGKDR